MKCPHCGQEHPDDNKFCPETGQKISLPKACQNKECRNFGKHILRPEARFCPECGKPLAGAASDEAKIRDAKAQYDKGECYYYGRGVSQDYAEAVKWYRKATEQGFARAQCNLGYCYEKGQGVEQSYSEAVKWYRKAAEQGDAQAQFNLAYCYYYGEGVSEDESVAVEWFRKAAEQGHADAQYKLDSLSL